MGVLLKALRPETGPGTFWPQNWNQDTTFGSSLAGVSVDAESAFGLPGFFAGARNIAEDVGKMPWHTYERITVQIGDRERSGKRRAPEHPLYRVLHNVANPEMTTIAWKTAMVGHSLTWGNCYSEIQYNGLGDIVALWLIPPHRATPKRDKDTKQRFLRVRMPEPNQRGEYNEDIPYVDDAGKPRVFHVPAFGYDGLMGYNAIDMMAKSIGVGLAAQEFAERSWANGSRPGGALVVPADLALSDKAKDKLMGQWKANHEGLSNAQRIAMLEDGITFQEIGITPEAAQFLETRKFQVIEMARGLRIPPHKIGDLERATFSNIEQQALEYVQDSLGAHIARFDAQAKKDLFYRAQDEPFFAEHLVDSLLKADSLTRYRVYAIGTAIGSFCPNDILERENMPPRTDPGGEQYQLPMNVESVGGPSSSAGGLGSPDDVLKSIVHDAMTAPNGGNGRAPAEVTA